MVALAVLSNISPSPLARELEKSGYTVYEAVEFSQILCLCDYIEPAAVVIACDVDPAAVGELAQRHIVIEQHGGCTTEQIIDTLTIMFGDPARSQ